MKTLRVTILLDSETSKADLANTFGSFTEINMQFKYLQFNFGQVKMLTSLQLLPIYNLLLNYEQQHGVLKFKMLHLFDDSDQSCSPISLQCLRGVWSITSSKTGVDIQTSTNLLTLI